MLHFDISAMADNELHEARAKFSQILGGALMTGNSATEQIQMYIDLINSELNDRAFVQNFNEWNKIYPAKIITDPNLARVENPNSDKTSKPSRRKPFVTSNDLKMARTRQEKPYSVDTDKGKIDE